MHFFPGDGLFVAAMILAVVELLVVAELLAMAEFSMTKDAGQEVVISLAGGFLNFDRSKPLIICFSSGTGTGLSLLGGIGHDLVTNKYAVAGKVEGHGGGALTGLDKIGRMVAVVVTVVVGH